MAYVCLKCHSIEPPKKVTPGSFVIELFLWLIFIVPGLIYSLWRVSSKYWACPVCGSKDVIPTTSPAAERILKNGGLST